MNLAGFNESIWHFLGYLHIADAVARPEKILDGAALKTITIDVVAGVPAAARSNLDVEDMTSRGVPILTEALVEEVIASIGPARESDDESGAISAALRATQASLAATRLPGSGFGAAYAGVSPRRIDVEYDDDAQQALDSVLQLNRLEDNDVVTSSDIKVWIGNGWAETFASADTHDAVRTLIDDANTEVPAEFRISPNADAGVIARFVADRDHQRAASDASGEHSVGPGRYVDGNRSEETPSPVEILPEIKGEKTADLVEIDGETYSVVSGPSDGIGAVAHTGGNEATNAAVIRDLTGLSASIIINGDAFASNAIIQVNLLVDNDDVELVATGADELLRDLLQTAKADGNAMHNIAEFITHDYSGILKGAALTPAWVIDVVEGDFFSVHALTQINYLTDNDRVSQSTETTFYSLHTGQNQQVNLANIYGFDTYDVIIIGGDSHRANWIFQKNIVLDSDWVTSLMAADEGSRQIADAGRNSLINEARISTYGNSQYEEINSSQRGLIEAVQRGDASLVPDSNWSLSGSASGVLKVLYITGDLYDINIISQTNVISDVDQVAQFVSGEGAIVSGVVSGGNSALNFASIIDAGTLSGSAFLGGTAYEDSILIQANIVTNDDQISIQSAPAYVPELIAFTQDTDGAACTSDELMPTSTKICDPALVDNPGNVMM
jgi:hypothetical protein